MRPQRIELYGFTAFRERQQIDLDGLDLFVVTGPTGAGKTSLLDSMIFALYGRVPRAGAQGMRELVTQGMAEARVELEFSLNGDDYRVARRLPRRGGQSATLERKDGAGWHPLAETGGVRAVNAEIEELLHLPYEAFVKAVVLPQGEFDRFLKGEPKERRQILVDLLGLKHYLAMGERARGRAKEHRNRASATEEVLDQQYLDVDEGAVNDRRAKVEEAVSRVRELAKASKKADGLEEKRASLARAHQGLVELGRRIADLDDDLADVQERGEHTGQRQNELAESLRRARTAEAKCQRKATQAQEALAGAIAQHGDLESLAKVEGALDTRLECSREQAKHEGQLSKVKERVDKEGQRLKRQRAELQKIRKVAEKAKGEAGQASDALQVADKEVERVRQLLARVEESAARHAALVPRLKAAEVRLKRALGMEGKGRKTLTASEAELQRLEHKNAAVILAEDLRPGEPCPVCARPLEEHPAPSKAAVTQLGMARKTVERERHECEAAAAELKAAEEVTKGLITEVETAGKELRRRLHDYETLDDLAQALSKAEAEQADAEDRDEKAAAAWDTAREEEGTAQMAVAKVEESVKAASEQGELISGTLKDTVRRLREAEKQLRVHFGKSIPNDASKRLQAQRTKVKKAQEQALETEEALGQARDHAGETKEDFDDVERDLTALDAELTVARAKGEQEREQLVDLLATVGQRGPRALPSAAKDRAVRAEKLADWCREMLATVDGADDHTDAAMGRLDDQLLAIAHEAKLDADRADAVCGGLRDAEAQARKEHGAAEAALREIKKRLKEKAQLRKKIDQDDAKASVLELLAKELRADRFVAFIQQETLDLLAAKASEELRRISGERYSLVSKDGSFAVIDHVNADEERSVDTLSGGETFMASLSLALALSQHIGDLATGGMGANLEAVFIDEGFGALDDETLEDVIDALERLREGDLMVGVITHVPALAHRIREGLEVHTASGRATVQPASVA